MPNAKLNRRGKVCEHVKSDDKSKATREKESSELSLDQLAEAAEVS
jgi:hypothetical protein